MRYKMKIDLWIRITLYVCVFMFLPLMLFVPKNEVWILLISFLVTAVIILPFFYGYIHLHDEYIEIKLGLFRQKVQYEKIKSIRICTNWLSSMAMTKDRIEIKEHKKGYIFGTTYIGPLEREECFEEIKRRCHNLEESSYE